MARLGGGHEAGGTLSCSPAPQNTSSIIMRLRWGVGEECGDRSALLDLLPGVWIPQNPRTLPCHGKAPLLLRASHPHTQPHWALAHSGHPRALTRCQGLPGAL